MYKVTNPATGEVVAEYATATDQELLTAISAADQQFAAWKNSPLAERANMVRRVAELFEERADQLADLITTEMGKRLVEARGEISVVVDIFNYYANNAEGLLADENLAIKGGAAVIRKCPIGVLIGIMPWN
jgi:succinate-semialdehyde dehydrogenase/glutarate-semialdehyde dehydrogenase